MGVGAGRKPADRGTLPMNFAARSRMEAAIQWLPTTGAGIFLTIAITAWFTPDRQLVAVWFGFAGFRALLLTGALQLHLYVTTSIRQPKIELGPPASPSHFR